MTRFCANRQATRVAKAADEVMEGCRPALFGGSPSAGHGACGMAQCEARAKEQRGDAPTSGLELCFRGIRAWDGTARVWGFSI